MLEDYTATKYSTVYMASQNTYTHVTVWAR